MKPLTKYHTWFRGPDLSGKIKLTTVDTMYLYYGNSIHFMHNSSSIQIKLYSTAIKMTGLRHHVYDYVIT
ncbi:ORF61 [Alphabaculovirus altermyunipunctae]|uniref:ORF61 n=1 Tax=Mythimna unipuncta nucleopolyhedrovirus TaxID=447897 RepID=A0A346TPJ8_9ABAC|nr:ORF61 [Mythimna unipuncta nucleopolyhedrovirus]AXU41508.1 ORF61 [Mythimna unipuncta nucleopolyhedrovirus]